MLGIAIFILLVCSTLVNGEPKVPCHFIFGDSLFDAGNNNRLNTMAKANYMPYGVDFPGGVPTGRFTNGLTMADFITQFVGFEALTAPYDTRTSQDILRGVNFASGASGILPQTGSQFGDRISMDRQIQNYWFTILQLQLRVNGSVFNYLNKCLYTVNIGSNDYLNYYFTPRFYPSRSFVNPEQYAQLLITRYRAQLRTLYNLGARKLAIFGLGQIGCAPAAIAMNNATHCVDEINQVVEVFNRKLMSLVDYFNANLRGANFTFINISAMQVSTPLPEGFITGDTCCRLRSDFLCEPNTLPCDNRDQYAFMDGLHPTQILNAIAATTAFNDSTSMFTHPMDINHLIST